MRPPVLASVRPSRSRRLPARRAPLLVTAALASLLSLGALGGCGEPPPTLGSSQEELSFGAVRVDSISSLTQTISVLIGQPSRTVTAVSVCAEWSRIYNYTECSGANCTTTQRVALPQDVYRVRNAFTGIVTSGTLDIVYTYRPADRGADVCTSVVTTSTGNINVPLDGTGVAPELTLITSTLPFADRRVNTTSASMPFTIRNSGDANQTLTVTGVAPVANATDWVVTFNSATALAPGESRSGTVAFSPKLGGARDTQLQIVTNDPVDADEAFALKGTGLFAGATAPATVSIAATVVGATRTASLVVSNSGNADSKLSSTTLAGANAGDFAVTMPALPVNVPAGANVTLTVQCRPSATGARVATLTLDTDSDATPQDPSVALSCTGVKPEITVAPAMTVAFGNVQPGVMSNQTVTVTNSAAGAVGSTLNVGALMISGAHAADFAVLPFAAFSLAPGDSRQLAVTFTPSAFGARTATLTITSDDQETPSIPLALTGTGFGPEITLTTAATLDFGDVRVATVSAGQLSTVKNDGNALLSITGATLVGANATAFALAGPAVPLNLPAGGTASWSVTCRPLATGALLATLRIASNDTSEPSTDTTLRCNGTQGNLDIVVPVALPVTFPPTDVGATSGGVTVTVRNRGTAAVAITNQPVITGAGFALDAGFALPLSIPVNGQASFTLKFTPTVDGPATGNAAIGFDGTQVLNAALAATGRAALLSVDPTTLPFGTVLVGTTSARPVTLRNAGSGVLNVLAAALSGAPDFTRSGNYPAAIVGGGVLTINVTCAPLTTGAKLATLALDTDADSTPPDVDVALSCTGVKPDIMLSDAAIAWGDVAPGTPTQRTLTVTNMAGATVSNLSVQAPTLAGAHVADFTVSPPGAFSLAAGASRVLTLTFTPTALGARTATLRLISDDQETPTVNVPLTGTGRDRELTIVAPGGPLAFGNVKLGTSSTPAAITLRNDGNADLAINGVTSSGADAAQFVVAGPATPATIAAGAMTTWTVTCTPTTTGAKVATLEIRSDDGDEGLRTFAMTCTGTQSNLVMTTPAAAPIAFASTRVGEESPLITVVVANTGTAPLDIAGPPLVTPPVFTVVDSFMRGDNGFTLAPGQNDRVTLRFRPTADGLIPGTLTITWDATSLVIPLDGPGTIAVAGVTPSAPEGASVELGAVCIGQPRTQHFTVDSSGTGAFRLQSIQLTGQGFTLMLGAALPLTVGPGVSYGFDVVADPAGAATITGTLTVTTDVPGMLVHTVPLRAVGLATGIGVAPMDGVDFGTVDPDLVSPESAVTLTNCNAGTLAVTAASLVGGDRGEFTITGGILPTVANPLRLAPSESAQWLLAFQPVDPGPAATTFHLTHDGTGGGTDVALRGRGTGGPDLDAGVDAGVDAGIDAPGQPFDDDKSSYYACAAAGGSGLASLVLVAGAALLVGRRRRRR